MLGTLVEIEAAGPDAILPAAMEAAFSAIALIDRLMSFHDDRSDVSRINEADPGSGIEIDPHTYRVLEFANLLGDLSGGAFDIATAPALVHSGFLPGRPHAEAARAPAAASYRDLELMPGHRVRWRRQGWIDLGGIAKGYAVDCAMAALASFDLDGGMVNAGGDLRCFREPRPIHVRRPDAPGSLIPVGWLSDCAMATSSGYFSDARNGGPSVDPLVDPKRHVCITWDQSVSVMASDCMTADALTKVVRLAPSLAPGILERFDAQALVIDGEGMRTCGSRRLMESRAA